jgi:hypothetical protein
MTSRPKVAESSGGRDDADEEAATAAAAPVAPDDADAGSVTRTASLVDQATQMGLLASCSGMSSVGRGSVRRREAWV